MEGCIHNPSPTSGFPHTAILLANIYLITQISINPSKNYVVLSPRSIKPGCRSCCCRLEVQQPQHLLWQLERLGLKLWTHHPTPDDIPPHVTGNWINKQIVLGCWSAEDIHPNDGVCFYKRDEFFPLMWENSQPICNPRALLQRELFGHKSDMGKSTRSHDYYESGRSQEQQHLQEEAGLQPAANGPVGSRNNGDARLLGGCVMQRPPKTRIVTVCGFT